MTSKISDFCIRRLGASHEHAPTMAQQLVALMNNVDPEDLEFKIVELVAKVIVLPSFMNTSAVRRDVVEKHLYMSDVPQRLHELFLEYKREEQEAEEHKD